MRDLTELEMHIYTDHGVMPSPPADENDIESIIQYLGFDLPVDYEEFLRFSNGGYTEYSSFGEGDICRFAIDVFFSVIKDGENQKNNRSNVYGIQEKTDFLRRSTGLSTVIAVACSGGGDILFIDVKDEINSVYAFWLEDLHVSKIASDFGELIDGLYIDPDFI